MTSPIGLPLDWLRSLQNGFLPETADIVRYTETNGPDGITQEWQAVLTDVPCRISSRTTSGTEGAGAEAVTRAVSDWLIWLPAETDVTVRDRIVVAERTFEIERVVGESYETARACSCSEVS